MGKNCGCGTTKCQTTQCGCQALISSDCTNNVKSVFTCLNIASGQNLTETLEQMDSQICELFNSVQNYLDIVNVGAGAGVYKGVSLPGKKELKSLTKTGNLLTITPSTNEINFTIDEDALSDFLIANQVTIVSDTLTVIEESPGVIRLEQPTTTVIPALYVNNLYVPTYEEWVGAGGDLITNPSFEYFGTGSLAKPITDSIRYTSTVASVIAPNTAIQNALDNYVGDTGTYSRLNPEKFGQNIIVQDNRPNSAYTFTGSFAINTGTGSIILEEGTVVISNPTGDWLCDFDTLSDTASASLNIIIKDNARLELQKSGFRNRGTSVDNSAFTDIKTISVTGSGTLAQTIGSLTNTYAIFESNYTTTDTYNNDSATQFSINGVVISTKTQSVYRIGGNSKINLESCKSMVVTAQTGLSTSTVIFNQIGGIVNITNTTLTVSPFFAITLDKIFPISKTVGIPCILQIGNTLIEGRMTTFISNETAEQATATIDNLTSRLNLLSCVNVAKSPSVLWTNFVAQNCIFTSGEVDQTQIDLTAGNTISTINTFARKIVESLQVFASRALAVSSGGLKKGNAFINRKTVTAGSFIVNEEYTISSVGSTDFTVIGASANTVGINFTATGVGTGSGEAFSYKRDILI